MEALCMIICPIIGFLFGYHVLGPIVVRYLKNKSNE